MGRRYRRCVSDISLYIPPHLSRVLRTTGHRSHAPPWFRHPVAGLDSGGLVSYSGFSPEIHYRFSDKVIARDSRDRPRLSYRNSFRNHCGLNTRGGTSFGYISLPASARPATFHIGSTSTLAGGLGIRLDL